MEISLWAELLLFMILMGFSGFFSSAETSLFSLSKIQLEQQRRDGHASLNRIGRLISLLHWLATLIVRKERSRVNIVTGISGGAGGLVTVEDSVGAQFEADVLAKDLQVELRQGKYSAPGGFLLQRVRDVPAVGTRVSFNDITISNPARFGTRNRGSEGEVVRYSGSVAVTVWRQVLADG